MDTREAIFAYSQSEKAKAGLLMVAQLLEAYQGIPEHEKQGLERFLRPLIGMIANEVQLARRIAPADSWTGIERSLNAALVMMNSGVPAEAGWHIVQAISGATTIGQRAMERLQELKLL